MVLLLQTALAEATGGAVAGVVADTVLYAIDSAKVRAQSKPVAGAGTGISILFRGLVPTILLGSVPVFGIFFFVYAPIRDTLREEGCSQFLPIASTVCAVPATIVGVPADVLKKRLVLGMDPTITQAIQHVTAKQGWRGLFAGWHVNLIRDLPFAGVKIGLYEWFVYQWRSQYQLPTNHPITPTGAALCGVASGVCCAVLTCPLDVVNTRIKAGGVESMSSSMVQVASQIVKKEGIPALFRGVGMRSIVLGIGSSIFWPIQRTVAHALQPYEQCPVKDILMDY
jgi:solute carrier family 25 S-adenosylmethionine transporter 26